MTLTKVLLAAADTDKQLTEQLIMGRATGMNSLMFSDQYRGSSDPWAPLVTFVTVSLTDESEDPWPRKVGVRS